MWVVSIFAILIAGCTSVPAPTAIETNSFLREESSLVYELESDALLERATPIYAARSAPAPAPVPSPVKPSTIVNESAHERYVQQRSRVTGSSSIQTSTNRFVELQPATITVQAPRSVNISTTATVEVSVALARVTHLLPSNNVVLQRDLNVSRIISVDLQADDTAFNIERLSSVRQPIFDDRAPSWSWILTPLKPGSHKVWISVHNVVQIEGQDELETTQILNEEITVDVTTLQYIELWIQKYWQWMWGAIVVPIVVWIGKALREKFRGSRKVE